MESNYLMFDSKSQRGGSTAGSGTEAAGSGGGGKAGSLPLAIATLKNGWYCCDREIWTSHPLNSKPLC